MKKKLAVILFSGGLDSTTLLAKVLQVLPAKDILCLSVNYGQKHTIELEHAKKIADYYGVDLEEMSLPIYEQVVAASQLLGKVEEAGDMVHESYEDSLKKDGVVKTYVPFRNGVLLSIGAALAYSYGAHYVYYGAHKDDAEAAYPDCSAKFVEYMSKAINTGTGNRLTLSAPFVNNTKADILALALKFQVPLHLTHSCYAGGEKACGVCGTCINRLESFKELKIVDPIEYAICIDWTGCKAYTHNDMKPLED